SLSPGVCQVSITLFSSCDPFYYALSSFLSPYVICPYSYSSSDQFLSHDDVFPLSLMIHSFPQPTSSPNDLTNRSHPPSCLCFLLLFYLWIGYRWSFCHDHSFST